MEEAAANRFPMTQRSVVDAIQSDDPTEKSRAIEAITAAYWKPIYKYFRLQQKVNFFDA